MEEKLFLFNPFNIKNIDEKELASMYQEVFKKIIDDPNSMYQYAHNIEVYSNLMYICGECIARFTREIIELKTKIQISSAKDIVNERNEWLKHNDGKPPAMSYFEAIATENNKEDIKRLADQECLKDRFTNAYDSLEMKCNALKKKMEAIRLEENFN